MRGKLRGRGSILRPAQRALIPCGIERGLFAPDGPLVRRWAQWLVAAVVLFFAWGG